MRTRTRSIVLQSMPSASAVNHPAETHYCNGTPTVYASGSTGTLAYVVLEDFQERMDDELGRSKSNLCYHRKLRYNVNTSYSQHGGAPNGTSWYVWPSAPMQWSQLPGRRSKIVTQTFDINSKTSLPTKWAMSPTLDENILIEDVFDKARGLKADVLLNIVEAHQLWPSVSSLASCLPAMGRNWNKIRKLVRTASGSYLAWKFGVSPILSDAMNINRYLPKFREDMERRFDMKLSRFSSMGQRIPTFDATPVNIDLYNGQYCDVVSYQGRAMKSPTVRYVLVVKPTQKYRTELFSALDTAMRRFSTSPASLAWEKVPFSFVLDWFVDLRGVCRAVDNLLGVEPFEIVSFTRSYSYQLATDVFWTRLTPCVSHSSIFDVACGTAEFSHYERSNAPRTATMPSWKPRFGKNQAAITAALIAQMLSKAK